MSAHGSSDLDVGCGNQNRSARNNGGCDPQGGSVQKDKLSGSGGRIGGGDNGFEGDSNNGLAPALGGGNPPLPVALGGSQPAWNPPLPVGVIEWCGNIPLESEEEIARTIQMRRIALEVLEKPLSYCWEKWLGVRGVTSQTTEQQVNRQYEKEFRTDMDEWYEKWVERNFEGAGCRFWESKLAKKGRQAPSPQGDSFCDGVGQAEQAPCDRPTWMYLTRTDDGGVMWQAFYDFANERLNLAFGRGAEGEYVLHHSKGRTYGVIVKFKAMVAVEEGIQTGQVINRVRVKRCSLGVILPGEQAPRGCCTAWQFADNFGWQNMPPHLNATLGEAYSREHETTEVRNDRIHDGLAERIWISDQFLIKFVARTQTNMKAPYTERKIRLVYDRWISQQEFGALP